MKKLLLGKLLGKNLISASEEKKLREYLNNDRPSLYPELNILLFLSISVCCTGLGVLIYQNIESIGHQVLIALNSLAVIACFSYCVIKAAPFSKKEVTHTAPFFDFTLLAGCLLFLILEGYLQFQFEVFGNRYGLATLIPGLIFLYLAYYFDHKGVLVMAITALASWLGISLSPVDFFENDFKELIWSGIIFGNILALACLFSERQNIKAHFSFTYLNYAAHILFISALTGMFMRSYTIIYALLLSVLVIVFLYYAKHKRSFYFLLVTCIYGYIGLSYLLIELVSDLASGDQEFYFILFYFIGSCAAIVAFFLNYKKLLR